MVLQVSKETSFVSHAREQLQVMNTFKWSASIPGYIYIEANNLIDVTSATHHPIEFIPVERASLLNLSNVNADLGHWVHVQCKGWYRTDLAHVVKVNLKENMATVELVPCISLDRAADTETRSPNTPFALYF